MDRFRRGGGAVSTAATPADSVRGGQNTAHQLSSTVGATATSAVEPRKVAFVLKARDGGGVGIPTSCSAPLQHGAFSKSSVPVALSSVHLSVGMKNESNGQHRSPTTGKMENGIDCGDAIQDNSGSGPHAGKEVLSVTDSSPGGSRFFTQSPDTSSGGLDAAGGVTSPTDTMDVEIANRDQSPSSHVLPLSAGTFAFASLPACPTPGIFPSTIDRQQQRQHHDKAPSASSPFRLSDSGRKRGSSSAGASVTGPSPEASSFRRSDLGADPAPSSHGGTGGIRIDDGCHGSSSHQVLSSSIGDGKEGHTGRGNLAGDNDSRLVTPAKRPPDGCSDGEAPRTGILTDRPESGAKRRAAEPLSIPSTVHHGVERLATPIVPGTLQTTQRSSTFFQSAPDRSISRHAVSTNRASESPQMDTMMEDNDSFDELWAAEDSSFAKAAARIQKLARRQLSIRESFARSHSRLLQNDAGIKCLAEAEDLVAATTSLLVDMDLEPVDAHYDSFPS